jgi:superfamily II DNA or RNA helicase
VNDSRSFGAGLLPEVADWLSSRGYKVILEDNRFLPPIQYGHSTVELRDYQDKVLKEIISKIVYDTWWPRGVLHLPVGSGKTEIAVAIYQTIPTKTLVLQNKKDLVVQTEKRFLKYGISSSVFGAGRHEMEGNLVIATVQSIAASWKKNPKATKKFLDSFFQVFIDEAHDLLSAKSAAGNTGIKILNRMPNAFFRWALSATAFDKDPYNSMSLKAAVGPISSVLEVNDLINKGYLSPLKVKLLEFKHDFNTPTTWPECLDIGIVHNTKRNQLIVDEVNNLLITNDNVLVMTPRVEHAYKLEEMIKQKGWNAKAVTQETPLEERTKAISDLRLNIIDVIVATTIFDQGIDIPELRAILLAAGGKSRVKAIQRLGRVLRRADGKETAIMVDIVDKSNRILRKHSTARLKIWEEFGFEIIK